MANLLLLADSYKVVHTATRAHCALCSPLHVHDVCAQVSHHLQYPPGTTLVHSYFESRGGLFSETVAFGLQYILKVLSALPGARAIRATTD